MPFAQAASAAPPRQRRLASALAVARLGALHLALGWAKDFVPVTTLAAWASRPRRRCRTPPELAIGRVLRAGALVGHPDRDCLQRSVLLFRELSRIGAPATLAVGFRRVDDRLTGHAWVLFNGVVIAEPAADVSRFVPLMTFESGTPGPHLTPSNLHA